MYIPHPQTPPLRLKKWSRNTTKSPLRVACWQMLFLDYTSRKCRPPFFTICASIKDLNVGIKTKFIQANKHSVDLHKVCWPPQMFQILIMRAPAGKASPPLKNSSHLETVGKSLSHHFMLFTKHPLNPSTALIP